MTEVRNATVFRLDRPLDGKTFKAVPASRMQADPKQLTPACLAAVRKLMQAGFLSSVGSPGKSTHMHQ